MINNGKGIKISEILRAINCHYEFVGNPSTIIENIRPIGKELKNSLVWISTNNKNKHTLVSKSKASTVICDFSLEKKNLPKSKNFILVSDPRLAFSRVIKEFFHNEKKAEICSSSNISKSALLGENVFIDSNVKVGNSVIGDNCNILSNVTIHNNVKIGNNCTIHSGSVIGVDGFGFAKNEINNYEKIYHLGGVIIEDNVEIFSNVSIAKGVLIDTLIKEGVKINNNCHIAHNVRINSNVIITAGVILCGSVQIESDSWIGPGAIIRDGLAVGQNAKLGMGSVLTKNLPSNEVWFGNPAKFFNKNN